MLKGKKQIADPVHGTVGLTEVEARVLESASFQRLRHVRQLGLANYVYPGAGYSRFEHSVGACHLAGRVIDTLQLSGEALEDEEIQLYRLAALLHDIGHYPFSHATEHALKNNYSSSLIQDKDAGAEVKETDVQKKGFHKHESVGERVLRLDAGIASALSDSGFDPGDVAKIFRRERPDELTSIVSSDLDVDRLDYLLRTAHATGLPYGQVDVNYLVTQMSLDDKRRVCLSAKAMRAAEHLLLARYFDYRQVTYHKTVVGFELALQRVLNRMVSEGVLSLSKADVESMIQEGAWTSFHDASMLQEIRAFGENHGDTTTRAFVECVLERKPAVLLFEEEVLAAREGEERTFKLTKRCLDRAREAVCEKLGIPADRIEMWHQATSLTKMGSRVPIDALDEEAGADGSEQVVRIMNPDGTSDYLISKDHSLMKALSNQALYTVRLYWFPEEKERSKRADVEAAAAEAIAAELGA